MKKKISCYPNLMKEWHPTLNNNLNPNNITAGSAKVIWWKCEKGHEWKASVDKRAGVCKTNCPYCSNKKVCKDNCLATIYPELLKEWHPTKNNSTPSDIMSKSNKKVWWQCDKNHEWEATCGNRTSLNKRGCPYCSNQKVCSNNCLVITHPEIAKEWHSTKNNLKPTDVIAGSNKKFWWICSKGHEWEAKCNNRTSLNKRGCPYCSNHKVCVDNCLETLFPEIAKEWHSTKNNLKPADVIAGSNKKFWWICSKGHEWKTSCSIRTYLKSNCPICNESKGEKEVAKILDKLNIVYKREFTFNNCKSLKKLRFDFVLKINNIAKVIEYHGIQHYKPGNFGSFKNCKNSMFKGIKHRDKIKRNFCKSVNIPLLEISYKNYDNIEEIIKNFLLL